MNNEENNEEIRKILERRQLLFFHIVGFICVNIAMYFTNLYLTPDFLWFLPILIIWSPALFYHFIHTVFFEIKKFRNIEEKRVEKLAKKREQVGYSLTSQRKKEIIAREMSFFAHILTYAFGNILFLLINFFLLKDYRWFVLSFLVWGLGLLIHYLNVVILRSIAREIWQEKKIKQLGLNKK